MRKGKISATIKQQAIAEIETGRLSQGETTNRLEVGKTTIRCWLSKYRREGDSGLESDRKNRIYSVQTKQQAVESYDLRIFPTVST